MTKYIAIIALVFAVFGLPWAIAAAVLIPLVG